MPRDSNDAGFTFEKEESVLHAPAPWGEPDMSVLNTTRRPAPPLPLNLLGTRWGSWITNAAEAVAAPVDYVALPLLATASALIGNARWAQAGPAWREPPHLWGCVVGESGSSKTPGANCILREIVPPLENRMQADFPETLRAWKTDSEAAKAVEEAWRDDVKKAIKSGNPPPTAPAASPIAQPEAPRLIQNDVTIERVATLLASAAPKGLLLYRDELAGWLQGMDSYSDAARPFWLECWNGGPYTVERQKHPEPIKISRNVVAVFGGTQPEKVAELFEGADDGLLSRFLWVWPEPLTFRIGRTPPESEIAIDALERLRCLELAPARSPDERAGPIYVPLQPHLIDAMEVFGRDMQARQQYATGLMKSTLGKARGMVLRLSLVLEYLHWCMEPGGCPPPQNISEKAFAGTCDLMADYFLPMAERVFGDAATPPATRGATTLARWIQHKKPSEVHVRTLQRDIRLPKLKTAEQIKEAAAILIEAGWLRPPSKGEFQSRAPVAYAINPALTDSE